MSAKFLKALESRYQAKIDESIATIELYLTRSAGVGEHPDIVGVLDEYISVLESNNSKLEIVKRVFASNVDPDQKPQV
jgi:hypothetical protein|tara:strand:+ start:3271 stop:3504 length:234 start_codon:yes stop_codon:yes gene_type:complete